MTTQFAWARALDRFADGYGDGPPDFDDPTDRTAFLALLSDEVRDAMERELATLFSEGAAELRADLAALEDA